MKRLGNLILPLLCGLALCAACAAPQMQYEMSYTVGVDTQGHYLLVDLDLTVDDPARCREITLNMPVWTPGYYEILDFPKHLCDFAAADAAGEPLAWSKEGKNRWHVSVPQDGVVRASYRIFADRRDVASSRVAPDVAFVSPTGVFMHVDGDLGHPVSVEFVLPDGWEHISSGLLPLEEGGRRFRAPDFDVLYDSPFLLGNYYTRTFEHEGRRYDFAIETPDGIEESGFEADFRRIVSAATQLMGEVPYDNYCLIHMGAGGGGLEHLNSQACFTGGSYRFRSRASYVNFMAFTAHEYFHLYNVKSIRPAELWPLNYDREAFTPMLWVSEGLTCYYEFRLLGLAGIAGPDEDLDILSKYFRQYAPYEGQRHMSLREAGYDIWLNFMNRDRNVNDVRVDYYHKGPVVGLLMDIALRRATGMQRSLDDVMRGLYTRYYKELRRGFTEEEFWAMVDEVAGRPMPELRRLADTRDDIDYDSYLPDAGLRIDTSDWSIRRVEAPDAGQEAFLRALNLL